MNTSRKYIMKKSRYIVLATIHLLVSFYTDSFIFNRNETNLKLYVFLKVLLWVCLFLGYQSIGKIFRKMREKDPIIRERVFYSFCYFGILLVLLVLIWPGIWRTDEFGVLGNVVALQIYWWQHFLTSLYYIISYMLIPIPSGVIIVQIVLVSIIFGYIAQKLGEKLKCRFGGLFLLIPFCIPSVLMFQLYPMRIVPYTMIEIAVLVYLFTCKRDNREMKVQKYIILAFANILLANWRAEGIYYIVLMPLLLAYIHKWCIKDKKFLFYILFVFFGHFIVYSIQSTGIKNERNDAYEMTAYAQSLTPLVYQAYLCNDTEGLKIAEKVIDVEQVITATREGKEGIECFWSGYLTSKTYSSEDFEALKKQYLKWIGEYPEVYMKERLNTFFSSYEQTKPTDNLYDSANIQFVYFLQNFRTTEPIFSTLRGKMVRFAERREWTGFGLPMLVMFGIFCHGVKYRRRMAFIISLPLIRIPLVFFTAPDNYFMYYYPMYVCGMVALTYIIIQKIQKERLLKYE